MKTVKVRLSSIEAVRDFVEAVRKYGSEIDLSSGRYVVDAKSIMGIFSLDLMKPITMTIHNDNCNDILDALKAYIVE
jgi:phosphotransferase system HPr-like phosphotransfer protein